MAQALQFELMLLQKDVIGEYLPMKVKEGGPGIEIGEEKWVKGLRGSRSMTS